MKILWITAINETEHDVLRAFEEMPEHEFILICTRQKNDYFFDVKLPKKSKIIYNKTLSELDQSICKEINKGEVDLIIKRAGWGTQKAPFLVPKLASHYDIPCAIWCAEQGHQREWQYKIAENYNIILANNKMDMEWYRVRRPDAKVYYLPFGCVPSFHKPAKKLAKYEADIVCYGNPLYYDYKSKRQCVDDMIMPLLNHYKNIYKLSIWGTELWQGLHQITSAGVYRGKFPYNDIAKVNSSSKIHIGLSSNIYHGGYGSKLARALSCGIFTIWHDTVGINEDFINGYHLVTTNSPSRTKLLVKYYLENPDSRKKIAKQGRDHAIKNLDYKVLFKNLFKEMGLQ
jgi:spore maturation protein CgeB